MSSPPVRRPPRPRTRRDRPDRRRRTASSRCRLRAERAVSLAVGAIAGGAVVRAPRVDLDRQALGAPEEIGVGELAPSPSAIGGLHSGSRSRRRGRRAAGRSPDRTPSAPWALGGIADRGSERRSAAVPGHVGQEVMDRPEVEASAASSARWIICSVPRRPAIAAQSSSVRATEVTGMPVDHVDVLRTQAAGRMGHQTVPAPSARRPHRHVDHRPAVSAQIPDMGAGEPASASACAARQHGRSHAGRAAAAAVPGRRPRAARGAGDRRATRDRTALALRPQAAQLARRDHTVLSGCDRGDPGVQWHRQATKLSGSSSQRHDFRPLRWTLLRTHPQPAAPRVTAG